MAVHLCLEQIGRNEARDVQRDDELPDIELAAGRCGKILDIAAEGRAVERSREQSDDDRKAAALVAAHGEVGAVVDRSRIGDRRAIRTVLHPAFRHRPAFQLVGPDRAVRGERRGDVEDDGRLVPGRDRHRDRVGAEQGLGAAPRRHVVDARRRAVNPDHAVRERDGRVDRAGAGVIGAARADPAHAGGARKLDGEIGGGGHHHMAHAVVAIDQRGRGRTLDHCDVRLRIHDAALELAHIAGKAKHAMRVGAGEVGFQHRPGHRRRISLGEPACAQGVGQEGSQGSGGYAPAVFGLGQHVGHFSRLMALAGRRRPLALGFSA